VKHRVRRVNITPLWLAVSALTASVVCSLVLLVAARDPAQYIGTVEVVLEFGVIAAIASFGSILRASRDLACSSTAVDEAARLLEERQQLREMTEMLQSARGREEAEHVLAGHLVALLPRTSGTVYLHAPSRHVLDPFASWGPSPDAQLLPDECWALRLGKPYVSHGADHVRCAHTVQPNGHSVCVPLVASGETIGVFTVQSDAADGRGDDTGRVTAVAERLAMPLANLLLRETLREQSIRDPLTGAYNRRFLEESAAREIARAIRQDGVLSLALLDLDHFKRINDTFGHSVGDSLLRAMGRFLTARVRRADLVCRFGGEEFALLLPGSTRAEAIARIDELRRRAVEITCEDGRGGSVTATFSAGVSEYPADGDSLDELLATADAALYRAKAAGRDGVLGASSGLPQPLLELPEPFAQK
jgi:diguanylate cyclase (GGDEF)-like protein